MLLLGSKHQQMEKLPQLPSEESLASRTVQTSSLCAETTAHINISCVNCATTGSHRTWNGIILGRGAPGSIKAYLIRVRLKLSRAPLLELLTTCEKCTKLKLDNKARVEHFELHGVSTSHRKMVFRVSHDQMEEMLSSKVVVLEGIFTMPFVTIGQDGQWKKWNMS